MTGGLEKGREDDGTPICCWCRGGLTEEERHGEDMRGTLEDCMEDRRGFVTSNQTSNQIVDNMLLWVVWNGQWTRRDWVTERTSEEKHRWSQR